MAAGGGDAGAGPPGPAGVLAGVPGTSTSWDASLGARLAGSIREACVAELGLKVGRLKAHGGGAADIEAEAAAECGGGAAPYSAAKHAL